MEVYPKVTGALCANSHPGSYTGQDAFNNMLPVIENSSGGVSRLRLTQVTGKERDQEMEKNENLSSSSGRKYVLRRLTPLECLRLQGLPDWWCEGANGSDSAIYKMCGNGLAIPCAYDVMRRIAGELESEK